MSGQAPDQSQLPPQSVVLQKVGLAVDKARLKAAATVAYRVAVLGLTAALSIYVLTIRDQMAQWQAYGYAGIFAINVIGSASVLVPVPSPLASIVGAGIYSPLLVGIVSGVGAAIGEMSSYMTGRAGRFAVENMRIYTWLARLMEKHLWAVVFLLAFIPNPFFDLTGMLAGALRVKVRYFFPVMLLGKLLKFITLAYLGKELLALLPIE